MLSIIKDNTVNLEDFLVNLKNDSSYELHIFILQETQNIPVDEPEYVYTVNINFQDVLSFGQMVFK